MSVCFYAVVEFLECSSGLVDRMEVSRAIYDIYGVPVMFCDDCNNFAYLVACLS